jgi:hypothetical protein
MRDGGLKDPYASAAESDEEGAFENVSARNDRTFFPIILMKMVRYSPSRFPKKWKCNLASALLNK